MEKIKERIEESQKAISKAENATKELKKYAQEYNSIINENIQEINLERLEEADIDRFMELLKALHQDAINAERAEEVLQEVLREYQAARSNNEGHIQMQRLHDYQKQLNQNNEQLLNDTNEMMILWDKIKKLHDNLKRRKRHETNLSDHLNTFLNAIDKDIKRINGHLGQRASNT